MLRVGAEKTERTSQMKKFLVTTLTLLTVAAMSMAVPISDVQQFGIEGEIYEVQGCVTALMGAGAGSFFIQDAEAAWSGIQIYGDNTGIAVGMEVMVIGGVMDEYYGWTELIIVDVPTNVIVVAEYGCEILPLQLTAVEGFDEPYEGVLCSFSSMQCTNDDLGNGEWEISDGTGFYRIDDGITWPDVYPADIGMCYDVTGVMYYSYSNFKVMPRSFDDIVETDCLSSVEPVAFNLSNNYPNPFNPTTTIDFDLAEPGQVSLSVFDMAGHQVATLVDGNLPAGSHSVTFDGSDLSSGIYFYMMQAGNFTDTHKMVLVK